MHISDEGLVAGSVNRAELVAAYAAATSDEVRANLAAVGAENGMYVEGDELVDPSAEPAVSEPEPDVLEDEDVDVEDEGPPAQADNKAAWVDYAVSQGLDREDAEALTKAELVDLYKEP